jgi:hypothetical protein
MKKTVCFLVLLLSITLLFGCKKEETRQFMFDLDTEGGLEISFSDFVGLPKDDDWSRTFLSSEMNDEIDRLYPEGFKFMPVTSSDGVNFYKLGESNLLSTDEGVLVIPLQIRSFHLTEISLTDIVMMSVTHDWIADLDFTDSMHNEVIKGDEQTYYLSDALRFSIETQDMIYVFENDESSTNTRLGDMTSYDVSQLRGYASYYYEKEGTLHPSMLNFHTAETHAVSESIHIFDLDAVDEQTYGQSYYQAFTLRIWFELFDLEAFPFLLDDDVYIKMKFSNHVIY